MPSLCAFLWCGAETGAIWKPRTFHLQFSLRVCDICFCGQAFPSSPHLSPSPSFLPSPKMMARRSIVRRKVCYQEFAIFFIFSQKFRLFSKTKKTKNFRPSHNFLNAILRPRLEIELWFAPYASLPSVVMSRL